MNLGFHTISLLLHDEMTAMSELAKIGFGYVAIQPRLSGLNPNEEWFAEKLSRLELAAREHGIKIIIETQSPFINAASLASADATEAQSAEDWIHKMMASMSATFLTAELIVVESGAASIDDQMDLTCDEATLERLARRIDSLLVGAKQIGVRLAIRPKRGNVIAKVTHVQRINQWLHSTDGLAIAADTAQMMLMSEFPIGERLAPLASSLACVFLTDPETTTHCGSARTEESHLPGRVDLQRVVQSLARQEIHVPMIVQIDGHSEQGLAIAHEAWKRLS